MKNKRYDAFISYRRENGFLMAQVIYDRLRNRGIQCFFDLEELRSGKFDEKILVAIREAHTFVLILPKNALNRCKNEDDWVRQEILEAVRCNKVIIPVMYDGFKWPRKWDTGFPEEFHGLENMNGVSGSQEYLPAMIDKIISYMPQEKLHIIPTTGVYTDAVTTSKKEYVTENEFVSTEKYFGDSIMDSDSVESVDMAFHAGAEWFTNIAKNDQLYTILDKGIRLRVLLNYPDVSELMAAHMRHKRKRYMKFEECIQHWQELSNEYPDTVEIRIVDIPVLRRYYSFHMKDVRKDTVNVKYYTYGNTRPEKNYQPIFHRDSAYFELYRIEFDYLWNRAVAFDEDGTNPPERKLKTIDTISFFTDGMSRITDIQRIDMCFRAGSEWHLNSKVVELLSHILEKGIKMRVIVNKKDTVEETARHMRQNLRKYYGYDQTLASWADLSEKYPELVSVRIADVPLMRRYYNIVGRKNGIMKVSYYTYGNPYPDQDCQLVIEASDNAYKLYSNEFEYLWNNGSQEAK